MLSHIVYSNLYTQNNVKEKSETLFKVSKKFTQSGKLCWIVFNWYLMNETLNKNLLVGILHVIFYKIFWSTVTFYSIRNRVLRKKIRKLYTIHKMVENFGKSWVFLIYLSRLSHIIGWWHCSTLIYTWKIAMQYFNYLPNSN